MGPKGSIIDQRMVRISVRAVRKLIAGIEIRGGIRPEGPGWRRIGRGIQEGQKVPSSWTCSHLKVVIRTQDGILIRERQVLTAAGMVPRLENGMGRRP